jgi:hypothetical protein
LHPNNGAWSSTALSQPQKKIEIFENRKKNYVTFLWSAPKKNRNFWKNLKKNFLLSFLLGKYLFKKCKKSKKFDI